MRSGRAPGRLPLAAAAVAPATLPPAGLEGLDPGFSRLAPAAGRTWHLLDNGAQLNGLGVEVVGTVLCVHGNPTWSYLWRRFVSAATERAITEGRGWRVVAVDQLDMGFSERTGIERDLTRRIADLADLTDELGLTGPVVTFGHDWGGVISLGWAVDHPDVLAGVMLLNTAIHQPSDSNIPAPLRFALGKGVLGNATVTTPAFLETTLSLAHPSLSSDVKAGYRAPYRGARRRGGVGGFVADIPVDTHHRSERERARVAEAVRELDVPSLMLWGPRDPIFSDRYLADLVDRLPNGDVHRFEGAGHLVAEDVDYAAAALDWLGDRFGPGAARVVANTVASSTDDDRRPLWSYLDAQRDDHSTALVEMASGRGAPPRVVSWRLLSQRVQELAAGLAASGVERGDRVSLLVQPGADLTAVLYACLRIGAIVVVADAGLGLKGLTRAVRGAWPDHVIGALPGLSAARSLGWPGRKISTRRLPMVSARALGVTASLPELAARGAADLASGIPLPTPPAADDVAAVLFTSGSTGPAKGVVYRHGQLEAVRDALADTYGVGAGTGLVAGFAPFALLGPALGARSVTPDMVVTSPKTLTASAVADAAAEVDATVLFLSPAALTNVVATSAELDAGQLGALGRVEVFLSAGAPVAERLLAQAAHLMPNAVPHTPYGMTEALLLTDVSLNEIQAAAAHRALGTPRADEAEDPAAVTNGGVCVGRPTPTTRIRIAPLDDAGLSSDSFTDVVGVTGEIVVSAPHVEDHYDRLWVTDRDSRRGTPDGERWHRTGDVGHLDVEGRLWVEGRLPHVITSAHGIVTPVAAEQAVERVEGVSRAAVVGVGPVGTQQIVVVAETSPATSRAGLAGSELADDVRRASPVPIAAVLVVPTLPTDVRHNSKIDRARLADWASKVLAGERVSAP